MGATLSKMRLDIFSDHDIEFFFISLDSRNLDILQSVFNTLSVFVAEAVKGSLTGEPVVPDVPGFLCPL